MDGLTLDLPISWLRDAIDIFVVALVVFRIAQMIRGTRGAQILFGLFVIVVVFIVSQVFELTALTWLMTHFVNNLAIILVLLFQDEIRRALAKMGRGPFASARTAGEVSRTVEEIIRAIHQLARDRVGALIVIARRTGLGTIIESGTRLDALVSQELIQTIFHFKTPLHDGAIVIDGDRVVAAGCVLPLPTEGGLPREFGTRHRAALGLSQETDALVVIVSEERGVISLARDGGIVFDLKPEEVRSELLSLLSTRLRGERMT